MNGHEVTHKKLTRGPYLSAHWRAVCESCGPIAPDADLEDAKRAGKRHAQWVAAEMSRVEVRS